MTFFQWFGYYVPGQDKEVYTLQESPLYQEVGVANILVLKQQCKEKILKASMSFNVSIDLVQG